MRSVSLHTLFLIVPESHIIILPLYSMSYKPVWAFIIHRCDTKRKERCAQNTSQDLPAKEVPCMRVRVRIIRRRSKYAMIASFVLGIVLDIIKDLIVEAIKKLLNL